MDISKIEELIKVLECSGTEELCVRVGDFTVRARKSRGPGAGADGSAPVAQAERPDHGAIDWPGEKPIPSPMVGIFRTTDGIAQVGNRISRGQVIGAIESMRLLNDVVSEYDGVVRRVEVEDGTPVEYGQPLCWVEVS